MVFTYFVTKHCSNFRSGKDYFVRFSPIIWPEFDPKSTTFLYGTTALIMPGVGNLRPAGRMRPAKAFYPARDLLLSIGRRPFFFNDRYAAINRRNDSHLLAKTFFCSLCHRFAFFFFFGLPSIRPKKGLNVWRRPFSFGPLEWWRPAGTLLGPVLKL